MTRFIYEMLLGPYMNADPGTTLDRNFDRVLIILEREYKQGLDA